MKKFILISPKNRTVYNFRGDLISEIINKGYEVVVTGPNKTDVNQIEALGARFVEIPMAKTGTNPIHDIRYYISLKKLLRKESPDVVLSYTSKPVIYGTLAARKAGAPNVYAMITGTGYTFTARTFKARILRAVVKLLYRQSLCKANSVIFQNEDDMNEFYEYGLVKSEKCHIVNGSGVNMSHFESKEYAKQNDVRFLMISRTLKSKGVREYLEAARMLKEEYPNTQFVLLGKYEYDMQDAIPADEIEEYIRDGIVERYGETNDTRPYYDNCDVYVLPSYKEGTPRTVLEAMSMGKPIITTDTNGCRGTVKEGYNGYLVPVMDSTSVRDAMLRFIEDRNLIQEMGRNSITYCQEKFEVGKVNERMLEIMEI